MRFRHVIQTRFNLATPGREASFRNRPDWLDGRLDLFERYCLPTIAAQTTQDFRWIVYFDEGTPTVIRERIEAAQRVRPFKAHYTPLFPAEGWRDSVLAMIGEDRGDALLTTNLDNDDGLANDFVSRLHAAVRAHRGMDPCAFNFTNGYVLEGAKLFAHDHSCNAFVNMLEPHDARLRTAPAIRHMELAKHATVVQVGGPGSWLQVVHGGNVSNKVRGRRVARSVAELRFPADVIEGVMDPGRGELVAERFAAGPIRDARDLAIKAVRRIRGR